MTRRALFLITAIGVAAVAGCYTGPNSDLSPGMRAPGTAADGTEPSPEAQGAAAGDATVAADGLPCEVAKVLAASCIDCHGAKPKGGAPNSLLTYEDLAAPSQSEPGKTVAAVSLERMKAASKPMPPDGPLGAADVSVFEKWASSGLPRGQCGGKSAAAPGSDAGAGGDSGSKPADAAADAASVCTSATTRPANEPASAEMHPGKECIACHSATGGPSFTIAGTVYPTLHEPNDCNGSSSGNLSVLIIDATGKSHTMPVNAAGNFTRVTSLPMPYRAMIVDGAKVREMKTPQTNGDCNGCHSEAGTHSPGRVMAP